MPRKSDPEAVRKATARMHRQLGFAWEAIRAEHPEVPPAVVIVGARRAKALPGRSCGFSGAAWSHRGVATSEVTIEGETMQGGGGDVLAALLHQAAHALAFSRGVRDTSRQGRYHNAWYGRSAVELGLTAELGEGVGYGVTGLARGTLSRYRGAVDALDRALVMWRATPELTARQQVEKRAQGWILGTCPCAPRPGRKIRASATVWGEGPITCGLCGRDFVCSDPNVAEAWGDAEEPDDGGEG